MLISCRAVGHRFGPVKLFDHITFDVSEGDLVAVTGPSGSGKTTLLGIVAGVVRPEQGEVVRAGDGRITWVFQNPIGQAMRSCLDHVVVPFLAQGMRRRHAEEPALELLARVGLDERRDAEYRQLSGGEAQRLMLARALATKPTLLLVDEPTAQLDRRSASEVTSVLTVLAEQEAAVLIATHDESVMQACGRVVDLGTAR